MSKKITGTTVLTTLKDADIITGVDSDPVALADKNIQITKANALKEYAKSTDVTGVADDLAAHAAASGEAAHPGTVTQTDLTTHKNGSGQHTIAGVTGLQTSLNAKADSASLGDAAWLDVTTDATGVARGDSPAAAVAAHVAAPAADAHANLPSDAQKAALAGPGVNNPPGAGNTYLTEEDQITEHSQLGGKDTDGHPGGIIEVSQDPISDADKVLTVSASGYIQMSNKTADQIGSGGSSGLHEDLTDLDASGHNGDVILVGGTPGMAVTVTAEGTLQNSGIAPGGGGGIGEAPTDGDYYARDGLSAAWVKSPVSPIGGMSLNYVYSQLTDGTPVPGVVQTNSPADLPAATLLYVNKTTSADNDASIAWDSYQAGDYVGIWEQQGDHGAIVYQLDAPPALTTNVYTLNVTAISGSDVNTVTNGSDVTVYQIPSSLERIPPLGLTGQALVKATDADHDVEWATIPDPGISDAPDAANYVRNLGGWAASDAIYAPIAHSTGALDGADGHVTATNKTQWQAGYDHSQITGNPHGIDLDTIGAASKLVTITGVPGELTDGGTLESNRTLGLADTTVTPGTYERATVEVDQKGRVLSISPNTASAAPATPERATLTWTDSGTLLVPLDGKAYTVVAVGGQTMTLEGDTSGGTPANEELTASVDFIHSGAGDASITIGAGLEQMSEFGAITVVDGLPVSAILRSRADATVQLWRSVKVTS